VKLRKHDKPIRPIVNGKESPGYKIAKHITTILSKTLKLPKAFNIKNTYHLTQSLKNTTINENTKLCSFDIKNMYTNILTNELKYIITNISNNDHYTSKEEKEELLYILDMILKQNYLQFNNQFYKQNEGLTMGAPTSATLTEIFIQHLQHTIIYKILKNHQIIDYHRYVDDILIIYNEHHTNIDKTLDEFNRIHPKIKFTIKKKPKTK
jgi:hypothetical protein